MDVYFATIGCRLNEAELESWARRFHAAGHRVVERAEQAELMLLNTCMVTAEAARKSRKLANRLRRSNPAARLVLSGCSATLEPGDAAALAEVDLVISNVDKDAAVEIICRRFGEELGRAGEPPGAPIPQRRTRAFLKVQDGCRHRCSYCVITVARGEERSRSIEDVVEEVSRLTADGYLEVVLTGVHLGGYGHGSDTDLRRLVEAVLDRTPVRRLRLSSIEPWDLPERFFELWSDERLCPHLHLPLQSGSDRVLRRMARRCDSATFARLVERARAAIPPLVITTDMIAGFPGEEEADHRASLDLCERIAPAHVHVFPFSPRPRTPAARLPDQVPEALRKRRSRELQALGARLREEQLARHLGRERPVLWEGRGEPCEEGRRWSGLTDNYLRVETIAPPGVDLDNRITTPRLIAVLEGDHLLAATHEVQLLDAP